MNRLTKVLSVFVLSISFFACGNNVGDVKFELKIDGDVDNDRDIVVDLGGVNIDATIADVSITLDKVTLNNADEEVVIIENKTGFFFGAEEELEQEVEILENSFTELRAVFGDADAAIAGAQGDANYEGNTIRLEGTIDFDGDVGNGQETALIVLIPTPAQGELIFEEQIDVIAEQQVIPEILIDLEALFAGVDFSAFNKVSGILTIDESAADQIDIIQNNFIDTFKLILE